MIKSELDNTKLEILQEFIQAFLPRTATKRKTSGNELDYIQSTLDRIFIQHFGFNLTLDDIIVAFNNLNYELFTLKGVWDSENKMVKPSKSGDITRQGKAYSDFNAKFVYVEIEASKIRLLRKACASLPFNTGTEKREKIASLLDEIDCFRQKHSNSIQHA